MGAWSIFCTPESFMNLPANPVFPDDKKMQGVMASGFQSSQQPFASSQDTPSSSSSSAAQEAKKEDSLTLHFDGKFLLFRIVKKDEILRLKYKAVSGRPLDDGSFDYSKERQKIKDQGPIPEGEYYINPQKIQYTDKRTTYDKLKGNIGRGTFKGGTTAWGIGRVWIYPQQVNVDGVIRDNFSIHGGAEPGSAGCIDLTNNDRNFFDELTQYRGNIEKIPLTVKY